MQVKETRKKGRKEGRGKKEGKKGREGEKEGKKGREEKRGKEGGKKGGRERRKGRVGEMLGVSHVDSLMPMVMLRSQRYGSKPSEFSSMATRAT